MNNNEFEEHLHQLKLAYNNISVRLAGKNNTITNQSSIIASLRTTIERLEGEINRIVKEAAAAQRQNNACNNGERKNGEDDATAILLNGTSSKVKRTVRGGRGEIKTGGSSESDDTPTTSITSTSTSTLSTTTPAAPTNTNGQRSRTIDDGNTTNDATHELQKENELLNLRLATFENDLQAIVTKEKGEMILSFLECFLDSRHSMDNVIGVITRHIPQKFGGNSDNSNRTTGGALTSWLTFATPSEICSRWIPAILGCMVKFDNEQRVQLTCLSALKDIMESSPNTPAIANSSSDTIQGGSPLTIAASIQNAIRTENGLTSIIHVMSSNHYNTAIQLSSCQIIALACVKNRVNRDAVYECNGIEVIIQALLNHYHSHPNIVSEVCNVIATITFENTNNKNTVREKGGIPAIVRAMEEYDISRVVARGDSSSENVGQEDVEDETDNRVNDANERDHEVHDKEAAANVQMATCLALWKLSFENPTNRDAIRHAGGIPAVVFALKSHIDNVEVVRTACGAIMNISHNHPTNKDIVGETGGIPAILAGMNRHVDDLLVQKHGCGALRNLIGGAENLQRLKDQKPERLFLVISQKFSSECGTLARSITNKLG